MIVIWKLDDEIAVERGWDMSVRAESFELIAVERKTTGDVGNSWNSGPTVAPSLWEHF